MNIKEKLQKLSEDELRQKIIMPLLSVLGCGGVRDNCGSSEYGKDILYLSRNHFLMEKIWGAALIKKDDIKKSSLDNIHRQISDAIHQFIDPDDPRSTVQLHEILVITPRSISAEASKYINEQSGKNFPNIHFVNGDRLEFLINQTIIDFNQKGIGTYVFDVETYSNTMCGRLFTESQTDILEGKEIN